MHIKKGKLTAMENIFVQTLELNKTYRINVSITKTEIYQKSSKICVIIIADQCSIVTTIVITYFSQVPKSKENKFQRVISIRILNLNQSY